MFAPTHALSRKVLCLTKPKDKIYKTKNDNIKKILLQLYNIYIYYFCLLYNFVNLPLVFVLLAHVVFPSPCLSSILLPLISYVFFFFVRFSFLSFSFFLFLFFFSFLVLFEIFSPRTNGTYKVFFIFPTNS